jgi:hypothetical protein
VIPVVAGLNAGLLVTGKDVVLGTQGPAFPHACVEIQDRPGLGGEMGIAGKDPVLVLPGLDRVLVQDPPDRTSTHGLGEYLIGPPGEVRQRLPTQRLLGLGNRFTGDGRDESVIQGGKSRLSAPSLAILDREIAPGPALPPPLHLSQRQAHLLGRDRMGERGVFVEQQRQAETLNRLDCGGSATHGGAGLLQERHGKTTRCGSGHA